MARVAVTTTSCRLNVFPLEIPPLRERREDIPMLVQYFIDRYAREANKRIKSVSKDTLDLFQSYPWPSNIRELRNLIERSIILCDTENFSVDESWLTESRGRVFGPTGATAKMGIVRSSLESKIKTLKIDKNRFKASNPS